MEKEPLKTEDLYTRGTLEVGEDGVLLPIESEEVSPKGEKRAPLVRKKEELDVEIDRIKTLVYAARNDNEAHRIEQENGLSGKLAERALINQEITVLDEGNGLPIEEIADTDIEDLPEAEDETRIRV